MDEKRGEVGRQRRRTSSGRPLHSCCVCERTEPWGPTWTYYGSMLEEDESLPMAKFCSEPCRATAGPQCEFVTDAQKQAAQGREWRPPKPYRKAPTYMDALDRQRGGRGPSDAA